MSITHWFILKLGGHIPSPACDERQARYYSELMLSHIKEHQRLMASYRTKNIRKINKRARGKLK